MKNTKNFKDSEIREIVMKTIHIRTFMNLTVAIIGIVSIIFTKYYPDWLVSILSIELIVLPIVYIIGNEYIEEQIKQEYEEILNNISIHTEEQDKIIKEQERKIYKLEISNPLS